MSIAEFYANKNIFVTGISGFIGKVLLEKLLRSCPDVNKVYVLIREKKNVRPEDRLEILLQSRLFERLKLENARSLEKVSIISGDIKKPRLGISDEEYQLLLENVNIVINAAADIGMMQSITSAITSNTLSLFKVVTLCREIKHLEAFCHVSTAFSQSTRINEGGFINEEVPKFKGPLPENVTTFATLEQHMDDFVHLSEAIKAVYPVNYGYSKALSEEMLHRECQDLPLLIFRPSVVTGALAEPMPGWIDNYGNVSGVYAAIGKGILRTYPSAKDITFDVVPVDLVVKCILACVWSFATKENGKLKVYHCTSSLANPTTVRDVIDSAVRTYRDNPVRGAIRTPRFPLTRSDTKYRVQKVFRHTIPAVAIDSAMFVTGQRPRLMRTYKVIHKSIEGMRYFASKSWIWTTDNSDAVLSSMSEEDREKFNFDMRQIVWEDYFHQFALGVKRYLLKDTDNFLHASIRNMSLNNVHLLEMLDTIEFEDAEF